MVQAPPSETGPHPAKTVLIRAFAIAMLLLAAPTARAAPTCQDRDGDTVRCGTKDAMPVGWSLAPQQFQDRQTAKSAVADGSELLKAFGMIGLLLALLALLPEFDGAHDRDWGDEDGK